jgi:hypothetical protein
MRVRQPPLDSASTETEGENVPYPHPLPPSTPSQLIVGLGKSGASISFSSEVRGGGGCS